MKNNIKKYAMATLMGAMILPSCTNLDEEIFHDYAKSNYYVDQTSVEAAVLRAHEHGDNVMWRGSTMIINELTGDQFVWPQKGRHGYDDGQWDRMHRHTWTYIQGDVNGAWENIYQGISQANVVLRDFGQVDFRSIGVSEEAENAYKAELRALRAWYYTFLLDLYRQVPIATHETAEDEALPQSSAQELFDFIVKEVTEVVPQLPKEFRLARWTQAPTMGLLVRIYLNAEAYGLGDHYAECAAICKDIIDGKYGSYDIDSDYRGPFFSGLNGYETKENLFEFKHQYGNLDQGTWWDHASHYGATEYLGANGGGWNAICMQPSRDHQGNIYQFEHGLGTPFENYAQTDVRRTPFAVKPADSKGIIYDGYFLKGLMRKVNQDGTGYIDVNWDDITHVDNVLGQEEWISWPLIFVDQIARFSEGDGIPDKVTNNPEAVKTLLKEVVERGYFVTNDPVVTGKDNINNPDDKGSNVFTGEENSGIRINKFPYLPISTGYFKSQCTPEMRLAEIYYSYAECLYRAGNKAEAAKLLDKVRVRYFAPEHWSEQSYEAHPERLTDDEFLKEWGREFIGERRRRIDLIRWDKFGEAWWAKKKDSEIGDGKERRWMPIPQRQLNSNPLLKQTTPGWEN